MNPLQYISKIKNSLFSNHYKITAAATIFLSLLFGAFVLDHQQDNSIAGTWISEADQSSKWVFTNTQTKWYYNSELLATFTYEIADTSPVCGREVQTGSYPFLELTNVENADQYCYYIFTLNSQSLSLKPFSGAEIQKFNR